MLKVSIDSKKLNLKLNKLIKELKTVNKQVADELLTQSKENFTTNNWVNKKDGTKATLVDTGKLKSGLKSAYSNSKATVYNSVSYSSFHQLGTKNIPARPFIVDDKEVIKKIVEKIILKMLKK